MSGRNGTFPLGRRSRRMASRIKKLEETVDRIDRAPASLFRDHRKSPSMRAVATLSEAGDQPQLRILSAGILLGGIALRNRRAFRAGLRMLLAHELATLFKNVVKTSIDRKRPRSSASKEERRLRTGDHTGKEMTSFPSGHTAGSVAVARAFATDFPAQAAVAYTGAGAVSLAQVPRCAHYPSDIAGGLLIGLVAGAAAAAVLPETAEEEA